MIRVKQSDFFRLLVPDECPDTTFLEEDQLAAYARDEFSFVGVCAAVDLPIPYGSDTIHTRIRSPGLWGVTSDTDEDYLESIFREEADTLAALLNGQTIEVV
jgi:hypothetical protein